jgi:hypothetical protein
VLSLDKVSKNIRGEKWVQAYYRDTSLGLDIVSLHLEKFLRC